MPPTERGLGTDDVAPVVTEPADRPNTSVLRLLRDLTDGLVSGLDGVDVATTLVHGCLEHTWARDCGILIADPRDELRVLATSSAQTLDLELLELQAHEGPCLDAYRIGTPVVCHDVAEEASRWPQFAAAALAAGVRGTHSFPLRLRERTIGALNVFVAEGRRLAESDLLLAEVLAGAAALGMITREHIGERDELTQQLQQALDSRVVIEQAKGALAARTGMDVARAFELLRQQARHERRPLRDVAADVVAGSQPRA